MSTKRALITAAIPVLAPVLAFVAIPAHAQSATDPAGVRHAQVHYGDLDLATAAGRHRLEMRLERSATSVCDGDDGDRSLAAHAATLRCTKTALANAHTALAVIFDKTRLADR